MCIRDSSFTRGHSAWEELLKTEAKIRKKRQEAIYAQQELRRKIVEIGLVIIVSCVGIAFLGFIIYTAGVKKGLW